MKAQAHLEVMVAISDVQRVLGMPISESWMISQYHRGRYFLPNGGCCEEETKRRSWDTET